MTGSAAARAQRLARRLLGRLGGVVFVVAAWWLSAETVFSKVGLTPTGGGGSIPNPAEVVAALGDDGVGFYVRHARVTLIEAATGYVWGVLLACLLAALVVLIPQVGGIIMQLGVISYCIPIVAIGPIARIVIGNAMPGEPSGTAIFLAALLVVFNTLVGCLLGLRSADRRSLEIVHVYGGGRWKQLMKVQLVAALPSILNALKIGAPLAFLGAIVGEYLGGVDVGIGPALVNAQQALLVPRAWALALVTGVVSGAGFALVALIARFVTPWSRGTERTAT